MLSRPLLSYHSCSHHLCLVQVVVSQLGSLAPDYAAKVLQADLLQQLDMPDCTLAALRVLDKLLATPAPGSAVLLGGGGGWEERGAALSPAPSAGSSIAAAAINPPTGKWRGTAALRDRQGGAGRGGLLRRDRQGGAGRWGMQGGEGKVGQAE